MDVFDLFAKLSLDSSGYEEGLKDAEDKGSKFGAGLVTASKVGLGALAAVGTAAVGAGKSFVSGASDVAEYGDNIDKMSQKIGISAEAYQEWDAVLQHSGASIDSMKGVMKTLSNQAVKNADEFKQLGISEQEVATLSKEDLFAKVVAGLQNMEEGTERTAIATKLLGRGATEFGALLNTSAEETQAMRDRVHELGGVMSDDAVKASAKFQDQLQDMQTAFSGLKRNMMSEFLPALTSVMDGLTELFAGNFDEGIDRISKALDDLVSGLMEKLPDMLKVGLSILENLAQAILQNIPVVLPALVDVVLGIAKAIIENLPLLIDVGIQIIFALIDGIVDAIPDLIPAIVEAIMVIVQKLTEPATLLKLIDAAIQIMGAIAQGIMKAIPQLVSTIPMVIANLISAIVRAFPQIIASGGQLITQLATGIKNMRSKVLQAINDVIAGLRDRWNGFKGDALNWGRDLIQNFINGIKQKFADLKNTLTDMASAVKDYIGFSEPDKGPLSNFHTFAPDMMELFTKGIKDNTDEMQKQIAKSFDFRDDIMGEMSDVVSVTPRVETASVTGDANNAMLIKVCDLLTQLVDKPPVEISANDAGIFEVVQSEARKWSKTTGLQPFPAR